MSKTKAPLQEELDANFGYVYNIVGPGGRYYVGKHVHTKGERWSEYTGSGQRLRDEQAWFEPEAFVDPKARKDLLKRKPGTALRYYRKYLSSYALNETDLDAKELRSITALVRSGTPTYNLEGLDKLAVSYDERVALTAFRLSVEPWFRKEFKEDLAGYMRAFPMVSFDLQVDALKEANRIAKNRWLFHQRPQKGLTF